MPDSTSGVDRDSGTPQQKVFISDKTLPEVRYWKPGQTYEVKMKLILTQRVDLIREMQGIFIIDKVEVDNTPPDMKSMDERQFNQYTSEVKRTGQL